MNGEDGNPNFADPTGVPYSSLQANDDHVGVIVKTAEFDVRVLNEESSSSASGSSNTGAN